MTICYAITPLINNAKDTSNEQLWVVLHLATILITLIVLVLSVLTIIYWKFNP
jgi:heme/copper-type cytochrome/quinol oxidase subunit 2